MFNIFYNYFFNISIIHNYIKIHTIINTFILQYMRMNMSFHELYNLMLILHLAIFFNLQLQTFYHLQTKKYNLGHNYD